MFLSNSGRSFLICGFLLLALPGCKWWQASDPNNTRDQPAPNSLPFSTTEPDTFQCQVIRSDGENEQKTFFARKGGNWRFDLSADETIVKTDKYYRIDREKNIYAEVPDGNASAFASAPDFLTDMTFSALKEKRAARFESLGRDGQLSKYSVTLDESDNARAVIYVDEKNGLIMKEEFFSLKDQTNESAKPLFIFELRDVKIDVDDNVLAVPPGYKKIAWKDYLKAAKLKK